MGVACFVSLVLGRNCGVERRGGEGMDSRGFDDAYSRENRMRDAMAMILTLLFCADCPRCLFVCLLFFLLFVEKWNARVFIQRILSAIRHE